MIKLAILLPNLKYYICDIFSKRDFVINPNLTVFSYFEQILEKFNMKFVASKKSEKKIPRIR